MRVCTTEYKINQFGEIDHTAVVQITFEDLDVNSFEELLYFIKLTNSKKHVNVNYENGKRYISVVGADFRKYIKII